MAIINVWPDWIHVVTDYYSTSCKPVPLSAMVAYVWEIVTDENRNGAEISAYILHRSQTARGWRIVVDEDDEISSMELGHCMFLGIPFKSQCTLAGCGECFRKST